jgi:hypothetical protein
MDHSGPRRCGRVAQDDPVVELGRILVEANRAYQVIAHRREAAA